MQDIEHIEARLADFRRKRGISAIDVAAAAGVSRQTIYAIEAGDYVPNTAVALRLARTLNTTVEDLFSLPSDAPIPEPPSAQATLLPGADTVEPGQPVQICNVGKRLMASPPAAVPWYFPPIDAVVAEGAPSHGKTNLRLYRPTDELKNRILVAGCDPAISVLSRHAQLAGVELVLAHRNSSQSLALLKEGCIHVAGTHLRDDSSGESNVPEIDRIFPRRSVAVFSFAVWEQGILTAKGNPKNIRSIADFARKNIRIVNREEGAGSRKLLDAGIQRAGIDAARVRGYKQLAGGHLPAAWQVRAGAADCCLATRAAARMFGLHFIPLLTERYDLVIRKPHLELAGIQAMLDTLNRADFRRDLDSLGGYDTSVSGQRLF